MNKDELIVVSLDAAKDLIDIHNSTFTTNGVKSRMRRVIADLEYAIS